MLTRVDGLEGVTEIDAGTAHTCARKGKEVYCWGSRTAPSADAKDESPSPVRGLEAYVIPAAARAPATPGG